MSDSKTTAEVEAHACENPFHKFDTTRKFTVTCFPPSNKEGAANKVEKEKEEKHKPSLRFTTWVLGKPGTGKEKVLVIQAAHSRRDLFRDVVCALASSGDKVVEVRKDGVVPNESKKNISAVKDFPSFGRLSEETITHSRGAKKLKIRTDHHLDDGDTTYNRPALLAEAKAPTIESLDSVCASHSSFFGETNPKVGEEGGNGDATDEEKKNGTI